MTTRDEFGLTPRLREVLQGYADGGTRETIAAELGISAGSVKTYLDRAKTALRAKNNMHAVAEALRKEVIA